ncbi:uromodulin-like [Xenopus laevis]|uniref:Uromodulin n=2 Tax=Xenopus laevis TaxID=8355 RepID=A0A974H4M0_XENLA|nr:uromodulin-like [Xenopus laevis]OCT64265.1 hypothetical protein XELAEV_18045367mg [Xenopus laevis]
MAMHILLALPILFLASDRSHAQVSPTIGTHSLTYLVDTTGSMYYNIQQLKLVNDWLLDQIVAQLPCGDRNYTMVEFNDPTFGQVHTTNSIEKFKSFFHDLYAYDGGDCPELVMNGLKVALETSPPGSIILVLTDASSKDYTDTELINNIRSLINTKQSQVLFLTTGHCWDLNEPSFLIYRDIASQSYGHVFQISILDMGRIFNYLDFTLSRPINSIVKVFYKYYDDLNHCDNFTATDDFTTLLVITDGPITSITIAGPDAKDPNLKTIVSESWGSLYEIKKPAKGSWKICVVSSRTHAVQVEGLTATNDCNPVNTSCEDCDPNAICEEYPEFFQCICKDGFKGDGLSCSDVNECDYHWLNNCTDGYCENTIGSYFCRCPDGYTRGTGNTCVDIDECSSSHLNKCHPSEICINYDGSYMCQCPPGVIGDGFGCQPDPCSKGVCGSNMECIPNDSSYSCSDPCVNHTVLDEPWRSTCSDLYENIRCDSDKVGWYRFIGRGGVRMPQYCVKEKSCNTEAPMWLNGSHPIPADGIVSRQACAHWAGDCCHWSSTVQIKACPGGYHVYKLNRTPTCSLAYCTDARSHNDDCSCTEDEECRFVSRSYGCYCKDNRTISSFKDLTPSVSCGVKIMKTTLRKCQLRALKLEHTYIYLMNSHCYTFLNDNTTNTYSVLSTLQAGNCGTTLTTNRTHAFYKTSFEFLFILYGGIIRDKLITTSTCIYPLDMRLSLITAVNPIISTTNISTNGTGEFKAHMAVFNSSDCKYPYEGTEITLYTHTVIYIGVFLDGPDPSQYALVLKNCYATPSSNPDDPIKYYIIKNRCPVRYDDTVKVQKNGLTSEAQFSFEVFAFALDYKQVYLHCEVYACLSSTGNCAPTCKSRAMDEMTEDTFNIKIGPFIRQDEAPAPAATSTTKSTTSAPAPTTTSSAASGKHSSWAVTVLLMFISLDLFSGK